MHYRVRPVHAALLLAFCQPVLAEQNVNKLSEIEIRADKEASSNLPASARLTGKTTTSDTASLLQDIPGAAVYTGGGVSGLPAINGLADDRLRIKVDGMDLIASCPNHMNSPLSYIDPSNLETMKVYSGISPVSAGGDSIGTSIIANTKSLEFAAAGEGTLTKGELGARYRSNGNSQGMNASATIATENFSVSYSGSTAKADNYKAGSDFKTYTTTGVAGHTLARDEVGSTAYESRNHMLTFGMRGGNHLIETKLSYQDIPYELYPNQRMDMLGNEQKRASIRYLGSFDWGSLEARAYHEEVDHFMDFGADKRYWYGQASGPGNTGQTSINGTPCAAPIFGMAGGCAAGMPMYTTGKTDGATLKANIQVSEADLLHVGAELQQYRLQDWWGASGGMMGPNQFLNINDGQRDRKAIFGEWEKQITPQLNSSIGLRFEQVTTDSGMVHGYNQATFPVIPVAGMNNQIIDAANLNNANRKKTDNNWDFTALGHYVANASLDVEFGYAYKTRSPNLYERYSWSTWSMAAVMNNYVGDGNGYVGNLALTPEKSNTLSTTIDWHSPDREWQMKATPFYTHVTDYIDAVRVTNNVNQFNVLSYANQSARLYGLNLSGKMPLGRSEFGRFGFNGLVNYVNGKNLDTNSGLYNIMPLNTKLALTQKAGNWDNALEVIGVRSKDDVSQVRNEVKTPGYGLVNLRTSYNWAKVRLDFGVENVFDRFYTMPLGGAYLGQGRTMSINPPGTDGMFAWGTGVPGMGRSFYAGINMKF